MKLLMLTDYWPTAGNPISGVFVQYQVGEYVRQGHEVWVLSPVPYFRSSCQRNKFLNYQGASVLSPPAFMVPGLNRLPRWLRQIAFMATVRGYSEAIDRSFKNYPLIKTPDAIHINGFTKSGLVLPLLKFRPKVPVILTLHGVDPLLESLLDTTPIGSLISATWDLVDRVVLCGQTLRSHAKDIGVPQQKISSIPNGSNFMVQKDIEKPSNPAVIVAVANLNPKKGVEVLVRAVHSLIEEGLDIPFLCRVIGDGPERIRLEKLVKDLNLDNLVLFLGRLTHDKTLRHMAEASIFCLPSEIEAFGIVFLEAMGAGIPSIGCIGTGAAEIIVDGETGFLVPPRDLKALTEALRTLLQDSSLRQRMGTSALSKAKLFTWRANVDRYLSLFKECGVN